MDEEGITFFHPFGTAKVNAPTFTGSAGCSAGAAAAANRKKTAAANAVLMRKNSQERGKTGKEIVRERYGIPAARPISEVQSIPASFCPAFLIRFLSRVTVLRLCDENCYARHDKAPLDSASEGGLQ
jgi:hypothetical protein